MTRNKRPVRLAIVVSHPIQHFVHFYRALHACDDIELHVFFATDIGARKYFDKNMNQEIKWDIDLFQGYNSTVLVESERIQKTGFFDIDNPSVIAALARFNPDIVKLHGYAQLTLLRALLWCRRFGIPVLMWSDSSLTGKRSGIRKIIKKPVLSRLFRQIDGFLSVGDNNARYFMHYGVSQDRIFRVPFTIDESLFNKAREQRDGVRRKIRSRYGIPDDAFVFLFVGKLASWKRPLDVLRASVQLGSDQESERPVKVLFAGNGELMPLLQQEARTSGAPCVFPGFINVTELPEVYVASDVLVHAAETEPYGLVIKEAACAGLPLVVSDQTGALGENDAARPGMNALVFRPGDVDTLAATMQQLYADKQLYLEYSQQSLQISREINIDCSVSGMRQAMSFVRRCTDA